MWNERFDKPNLQVVVIVIALWRCTWIIWALAFLAEVLFSNVVIEKNGEERLASVITALSLKLSHSTPRLFQDCDSWGLSACHLICHVSSVPAVKQRGTIHWAGIPFIHRLECKNGVVSSGRLILAVWNMHHDSKGCSPLQGSANGICIFHIFFHSGCVSAVWALEQSIVSDWMWSQSFPQHLVWTLPLVQLCMYCHWLKSECSLLSAKKAFSS